MMKPFLRNANGEDTPVKIVARRGRYVTVVPADGSSDTPATVVSDLIRYEAVADPPLAAQADAYRDGLKAVITAFLDSTLNEAQALRAMHAAAQVALRKGDDL